MQETKTQKADCTIYELGNGEDNHEHTARWITVALDHLKCSFCGKPSASRWLG
jgi:hypothetical protein